MHASAAGVDRETKIKQVEDGDVSVRDYGKYLPIGNAPQKISAWHKQGAEIVYLTSRRKVEEIAAIKQVLDHYGFPEGKLEFRGGTENYGEVAVRIKPDIIIEDDCESIGGRKEMIYPKLPKMAKQDIVSIVVKEFQGIDHLPDDINKLKVG